MVNKIDARAMPHGNGGLRIHVPSKLQHDSQNPIQPGTEIRIEVDGRRMVITPIKGAEEHPNIRAERT